MKLQQRDDFLSFTAIFLTGLLLLAMLLSTWSGIEPLTTIDLNAIDLGIGILAALGMVVIFSQVKSAQDEAEEAMGASLAACYWYDLILLALLVGFIEEVLFRGVLEPWVAMWSPIGAVVIVNLLFGALHSLSMTYFVVATILGIILSLLAQGPGEYNLLRPIIAHAFYDYIGFLWLAHRYSKRPLESESSEDPDIKSKMASRNNAKETQSNSDSQKGDS